MGFSPIVAFYKALNRLLGGDAMYLLRLRDGEVSTKLYLMQVFLAAILLFGMALPQKLFLLTVFYEKTSLEYRIDKAPLSHHIRHILCSMKFFNHQNIKKNLTHIFLKIIPMQQYGQKGQQIRRIFLQKMEQSFQRFTERNYQNFLQMIISSPNLQSFHLFCLWLNPADCLI